MPQLLIVDDDEALRRWEERVVRDNGYTCDSACDAQDARAHLQKDSYRLALLDVNMPESLGSICSRRSGGTIRTSLW